MVLSLETPLKDAKDTASLSYQDDLQTILHSKRYGSLGHLPDWVYDRLVEHVRSHSAAYWVEGTTPAVRKGWVVE